MELLKTSVDFQTAISTKGREKHTNPKDHWLDYAESTHGKKLVMETKILLNVLVLYLPLPFFWALFDQQGSRWTFQATRMNGDLGFYTIKPDQMQVINPLLILVFIPLYEVLFYPLLNLVGVRRPLQKIALGGVLAGVAFVASMLVEITIEKTYPVLPVNGEAQLRIFNGLGCDYKINTNLLSSVQNLELPKNSHFMEINVPINGETSVFPYSMTTTTSGCSPIIGNFTLNSKQATSYFIKGKNDAPIPEEFEDDPDKSRNGTPLIRILANLINNALIVLKDKDGDQYKEDMYGRNLTDVPANTYEILVGGKSVKKDVELGLGGVYTIVVQEKSAGDYVRVFKAFTDSILDGFCFRWLKLRL
jgi:solute carrier family 15 (oligopeptide transporter), member 1